MQAPFSEAHTVYVVDDEASVRRSLCRLLRSLGLVSRPFASGTELLSDEHLAEAACIVVDIHMPEMDGYELARRLAVTAPDSGIIFISAAARELDHWRSLGTPAIALLLKPFSEEELSAAVRQAVSSRSGSGAPAGS